MASHGENERYRRFTEGARSLPPYFQFGCVFSAVSDCDSVTTSLCLVPQCLETFTSRNYALQAYENTMEDAVDGGAEIACHHNRAMGRKRKLPADYAKEYPDFEATSSNDLVVCKFCRVQVSTANEKGALRIAEHHGSNRHIQLKKPRLETRE
ncbi:hypothetical protein HPB48_020212 [Haemaphysalis longicornis]|uniref:Uncharacterized protein n=1 Tax=Haemaphysalis longicornis TaxID=44386 RepID=A0A9J6FCR4_HAELO|nr:hypothetical protein HPB48_020212 [Haemaphysalis longicornis]